MFCIVFPFNLLTKIYHINIESQKEKIVFKFFFIINIIDKDLWSIKFFSPINHLLSHCILDISVSSRHYVDLGGQKKVDDG